MPLSGGGCSAQTTTRGWVWECVGMGLSPLVGEVGKHCTVEPGYSSGHCLSSRTNERFLRVSTRSLISLIPLFHNFLSQVPCFTLPFNYTLAVVSLCCALFHSHDFSRPTSPRFPDSHVSHISRFPRSPHLSRPPVLLFPAFPISPVSLPVPQPNVLFV